MSEFHKFEADEGLVHHIIQNQNGTIETSLIELICNSIDAGSDTVKIILTNNKFEILDHGKGFKDKEEIMNFFKKFGTPHAEGDATFGRFRIGRGQIISFSDAVWHSKEFKMKTCIKNNSYGFEFIEDKNDYIDGCKVSGHFKNEIREWDLSSIKKELINKLKYIDAVVLLNGIQITEKDVKWDFEDEDIKILWNPKRNDGIKLYSQGVFVKDIQNYYYDLNADIISKNALKLNMARNETNVNDGIWKKINNILIKKSQEIAKNNIGSRKLDEKARRGIVNQLIEGLIRFDEALNMSILKDSRGHTFSIRMLINKKIPLSIANKNEKRKAEWLSMQSTATILDSEELRIWDVENSTDLKNKLEKILKRDNEKSKIESYNYYLKELNNINSVDFDKLAININDSMKTLKNSDLNVREAAARNAVQAASNTMAKRLSNLKNENIQKRKIIIGESCIADAWTDSESYIVVTRKMLKLLDSGFYGAIQISLLILHEYIHDKSSFESHEHDFDFYKQYHDISSHSSPKYEITGHVANTMMHKYNVELLNKMEKLPKEVYQTFKFPIVNRLNEYEIFIGEGGISKLGMMILEMMPYKYKKQKNKITLNIPSSLGSKDTFKYKRNILKMANESDSNAVTIDELLLKHNFKEALKIKNEIDFKIIESWLINNGHDKKLAKSINENSKSDNIIRILAEDENSDVIYYKKNELSNIERHGSKYHNFNFKINRIGGNCDYHARDKEVIATKKSERFLGVKGAMLELLSCLTDEDERKEFIDQFLSDDFKKEFD